MDVMAVVLYRGCLTYYEVIEEDKKFRASLVKYAGYRGRPPEHILFEKDGRHCTGTAEEELMDDLWDAVEEAKAESIP